MPELAAVAADAINLNFNFPTMRSKSNKSSALLGTALATAAMMLPSVQFASADVAPERGIISFKYLNYQEHQGALGTSVATPGPAVSENHDVETEIEHKNESHNHNEGAVWVNLVSGASALPSKTRLFCSATASWTSISSAARSCFSSGVIVSSSAKEGACSSWQ